MATTTVDNWVEIAGGVEPRSIAADIAKDATDRIAEFLVCAADWLSEDGNEFNQRQKMELTAAALHCMDGFERATETTLREALARANERVGGESDAS